MVDLSRSSLVLKEKIISDCNSLQLHKSGKGIESTRTWQKHENHRGGIAPPQVQYYGWCTDTSRSLQPFRNGQANRDFTRRLRPFSWLQRDSRHLQYNVMDNVFRMFTCTWERQYGFILNMDIWIKTRFTQLEIYYHALIPPWSSAGFSFPFLTRFVSSRSPRKKTKQA